jgi:hypothetical protein
MATQKDMRVRLSAEGQAEVIKAFRSVQAEALKSKQSAQDASKGFDQLAGSARSLAVEFLSYEAALRVFDGIKGAVENAVTFAASMGKLQEKTGLSATTLQVFAAAAKRVDVSQETVSKGLGLFSKAMGNLQQGSTKAAVSLKLLLGSADALKGLTADEKLRKITDGLAKMTAGSQKAKITTDLFGKAGLELLPVIDQLGGQGFDVLKGKLEAFGALLTDDAIQQAKVAEETFGDLKLASQGVALQFTEGLLPALTNVAGGLVSLAGDAHGGGNAIKELGAEVGDTTKKLIFGFFNAMTKTREFLDFLVADMTTAGQLLDSWHPFRDFKKIMEQNKNATHAAVLAYKQEQQALVDIQNAGDLAEGTEKRAAKLKAAGEQEVVTKAQIAAAERLAKARLELKKATAQAELHIDQETNREAVAFEKERFTLGMESVTAYYKERHRLSAELATEEAANLDKEIKAEQAALRSESDPAKKLDIQRTILGLQTQASIQRQKAQESENLLVSEEAAERKKLQTEQLSFEDKLLAAQGNTHQIAMNAIDAEAEKYRKELIQAGDQDVDEKVAAFTKALTAEADFKEAQKQLLDTMRLIEDARARIDNKFETGAITAKQRSEELANLDRARLPLLNQQYKVLKDIADLSGLKPLVSDAEQAGIKVEDLNAKLMRVRSTAHDAGVVFEKSLGKDLGEFLTKGIANAHSIGDAFRTLASNITQDFTKMMEKIIMEKLKAKLMGNAAGGGGQGGGGFFGFLSGLMGPGKALGGEIYGPGTGTSDSVPIWASRGEFVVKSAAVAQPGVRELLHTINSGLVTPTLATSRGPRFAAGGEVSGGFVLGGSKSPNASLTVGLDYGLLIKSISAHPDFGKIVVQHAAENRKAMNSALGK